MARVKASTLVRLSIDGTVGTIADLLKAGRLVPAPEPVQMYSKRTESGARTAYFLDVVGDDGCFEVGKLLWQSRSGQPVNV